MEVLINRIGLIKKLLIAGLLLGTLGAGYAYYLFNLPHRDVQAVEVFVQLDASKLVAEFLNDATSANEKYLDSEGESKVIIVTGTVESIELDQNEQRVVLLKQSGDEAGVSCTFTIETSTNADNIQVGQQVSIKGVVRSGAELDEDLDLVEDVILEKCDLVKSDIQ